MPHTPSNPDRPTTYLFRTTEDKVDQHLETIAEAGDVVEHTIFKGGRDYVFVVRRGGVRPLVVQLSDASVVAIAAAVRNATRDRNARDVSDGAGLGGV